MIQDERLSAYNECRSRSGHQLVLGSARMWVILICDKKDSLCGGLGSPAKRLNAQK